MRQPLTDTILLIGSPGDPADLLYASGFHAVDPVVFLQQGARKYLVVPLLELGRARKESPQACVWTPQDLGLPKARRREVAAWALGLLRRQKLRRVAVDANFPAAVLRALERANVRVDVRAGECFPSREVKSDKEIFNVRQAQCAAVAAMRAAIREIGAARPGRAGVLRRRGRVLQAEDVRLVIDQTLLRHGCAARDSIVACGAQAADPHDRGSGPLRAGQSIVLDIFPQHKSHGYWGDITRTVVKGEPAPRLAAMYRAVAAAQRVGLGMIRPGQRTRRIHEAVQRELERHGFRTSVQDGVARGFFHGTGHGVGLDIHEAPSLSLAHGTLRAGHVVTVEPGLYYPEWGGVRLEDTVVVTRHGCEILCPCPKKFRV